MGILEQMGKARLDRFSHGHFFLLFFFSFDKVVNVYLAFTLLFFSMFFNVDVESYFQMAAWHFLVECLFIYILFSL